MPTFVDIAINIPQVSGTYHYHLSPELEDRVGAGHLVIVPFGKQTVQGVVIGIIDFPDVPETKSVISLVDPLPVLTPVQIKLAQYIAENTLSPLAPCVDLMIPPGLSQQSDLLLTPRKTSDTSSIQIPLNETQTRLLNLLNRRGAMRGSQIDRALPHFDWRAGLRPLVKRGLVMTQSVLPPPTIHPKMVRTVQLACTLQAAQEAFPDVARNGSKALARRQAILRFLMQEATPVDVTWVYAQSGGDLQDLLALAEKGLVVLRESEVWRDPLERIEFIPTQAPSLTRDQLTAWREIQGQIDRSAAGEPGIPVLLHGVTGAGKTELYLRAVQEMINLGRQSIVLVPEIALTAQTVHRFASRFPGQVGLVHSGLSTGERYDTWRRARNGDLAMVVGPRSALFTPFSNLGLIVVDECHDDSYFQNDPLPYYHARQVAMAYARLAGAVCLLGSATPDILTTYQARQGQLINVSLPARILAHRKAIQLQLDRQRITRSEYQPLEGEAEGINLPTVNVVDMRRELKAGNRSIFSRQLQSALEEVLKLDQQAILFLNRRGTATYIFCRTCGHSLECPRCNMPLTYHLEGETREPGLMCHHCGYRKNMPPACPQCGSRQIRHYGTGTEKVQAEVEALFPQARTLRWDAETTRKKGANELILSNFSAHRADILIGTQMLAKGLDIPLVTLVGVILADVGLNMPDYRAAERTFQVLTQVAGRAGRSPLGGQVILQTFEPDHYVIQAASHHDYWQFYERELAYRRKLGYPPFTQLVRLEYRDRDPQQAEAAAEQLSAQIREWVSPDRLYTQSLSPVEIIGPTPCFYQRIAGVYRWQVILRGTNPLAMLRDHPLTGWRVEVNPLNLL